MCNSEGGVETKDRDGESSSIRFSLAEGALVFSREGDDESHLSILKVVHRSSLHSK